MRTRRKETADNSNSMFASIRRDLPDWLNKLDDDKLKEYFMSHPTSKYNPWNMFPDADDDYDAGEDEDYDDIGKKNKSGKNYDEDEELVPGKDGEDDKPPKLPEKEEKPEPIDEPEPEEEKHKLPLIQRLTFNGWTKSAPTKEVKQKLKDYNEMKDDLLGDNDDIRDILDDMQDQQKDDRSAKSDTDSPRRKKRLSKRLAKRGERINKLKSKIVKNKERIKRLKERMVKLDKELKQR